MLETKSGIIKHFAPDINNSNSLSHDAVMAIYNDIYDNLWISTLSGGLYKFNPATGQFRHFKFLKRMLSRIQKSFTKKKLLFPTPIISFKLSLPRSISSRLYEIFMHISSKISMTIGYTAETGTMLALVILTRADIFSESRLRTAMEYGMRMMHSPCY